MMGWYDEALLARAAKGPMTAAEIGLILKGFGPDAVSRLRSRRDLEVVIVGTVSQSDHKGPARKLYQVEKRSDEGWYGGTTDE